MAAYCQVYGVIHFTSPAGWLSVHQDQLQAQRSVTSMGKVYLYWREPTLKVKPTDQRDRTATTSDLNGRAIWSFRCYVSDVWLSDNSVVKSSCDMWICCDMCAMLSIIDFLCTWTLMNLYISRVSPLLCFLCIYAPVLYHLVAKTASFDRY